MFLTDPGLVPAEAGDKIVPDLWYLDGPLIWKDAEVTITVPVGFLSDDASTPKFLDAVPWLDRQGLSRRPGLAHDALYSLGRSRGKDWADKMLQAFCLAEGMNAFQAACYYQGVHLFGASSWAGDARLGTAGAITGGDFIEQKYYDAFLRAGGTIYS